MFAVVGGFDVQGKRGFCIDRQLSDHDVVVQEMSVLACFDGLSMSRVERGDEMIVWVCGLLDAIQRGLGIGSGYL